MMHHHYAGICWNCRRRWPNGPKSGDGHCQEYPGVPEMIVTACRDYQEGAPKPRRLGTA